MNKRKLGFIFQIPAMLLLIMVFVGLIIAPLVDERTTYAHSAVVWIIIILYFIGLVMEKMAERHFRKYWDM